MVTTATLIIITILCNKILTIKNDKGYDNNQ